MKRFFCTVCKKMKRVRKFPVVIETPNAEAPANRIGACNWHSSSTRFNSSNQTKREKVAH